MQRRIALAQDRLLDIGIGTGLGSLPFAKTGLEIFGIDGSGEMLKCLKFFVLSGQEDIEDLCYAYVAQSAPSKSG